MISDKDNYVPAPVSFSQRGFAHLSPARLGEQPLIPALVFGHQQELDARNVSPHNSEMERRPMRLQREKRIHAHQSGNNAPPGLEAPEIPCL